MRPVGSSSLPQTQLCHTGDVLLLSSAHRAFSQTLSRLVVGNRKSTSEAFGAERRVRKFRRREIRGKSHARRVLNKSDRVIGRGAAGNVTSGKETTQTAARSRHRIRGRPELRRTRDRRKRAPAAATQ